MEMDKFGPGMAMPRTLGRDRWIFEFKGSLVYIATPGQPRLHSETLCLRISSAPVKHHA